MLEVVCVSTLALVVNAIQCRLRAAGLRDIKPNIFRPGNVFACTLASAAATIVVFVLLGIATLALGLLPLLLRLGNN